MADSQNSGVPTISAESVCIAIPWYRRAFRLGPGARFRKRVAEILVLRTPADVQAAWNSAGVNIDLAAKVSRIIAEWCEWPNALFLPDDECAYLFSDVGYDLSIVGAMRQIEEDIVPNLNHDVWPRLFSLSYGEFIGHIQAQLAD